MPFKPTEIKRPVCVDRVVTVHYFEYSSSYCFEGEKHDFWEFVYVDKGEVDVIAGGRQLRLGRGNLLFHPPGEFHALRATGGSAPNLVVVSFFCEGEAAERIGDEIYPAGEAERALIGGRYSSRGGARLQDPA